MFRLTEDLRFYLYTGKVNLRRGCFSLCEIIRREMKSDPCNERNVYIFMNSARTIMRLIHYSNGFFTLYERRPSSGRFRKPVYDASGKRFRIGFTDLVCLTQGLVRTDIRLAEMESE